MKQKKDQRTSGDKARTVYSGESQSVRDVQFHPSEAHSFAASFDSGVVQVLLLLLLFIC